MRIPHPRPVKEVKERPAARTVPLVQRFDAVRNELEETKERIRARMEQKKFKDLQRKRAISQRTTREQFEKRHSLSYGYRIL